MKQRPIMIGDAVHEKLMELKRSLEEKLDEQVSFNAFLLMMLEEFERLNEAVRRRPDDLGQEFEKPIRVIGQPSGYEPYKWTVQPMWYTQDRYYTDNKTAPTPCGISITIPSGGGVSSSAPPSGSGSSTDFRWYNISSTGTTCKSCGHKSSVVNGACTNCGVSQ